MYRSNRTTAKTWTRSDFARELTSRVWSFARDASTARVGSISDRSTEERSDAGEPGSRDRAPPPRMSVAELHLARVRMPRGTPDGPHPTPPMTRRRTAPAADLRSARPAPRVRSPGSRRLTDLLDPQRREAARLPHGPPHAERHRHRLLHVVEDLHQRRHDGRRHPPSAVVADHRPRVTRVAHRATVAPAALATKNIIRGRFWLLSAVPVSTHDGSLQPQVTFRVSRDNSLSGVPQM